MEKNDSKTTNAKSIIGVCIALGSFVVFIALDRLGVNLGGGFLLDSARQWAIFLLVMVWAARIEGLSLSLLGLKRPTLGTFGWGVLAALAVVVSLGVYYVVIAHLFGTMEVPALVGKITRKPMYEILIICLNPVVEEMLFRFYAMSRLLALTGNKWIAFSIPIIVEAALHVPSVGLAQVIPAMLGIVVFTALYWFRRDFLSNAIAHFLVVFTAFGAMAMR
jgi:membrane protease YdiL (CAAX protease family)